MDYQAFLSELERDDDGFKKSLYRRYKKHTEEKSLKPYQAELIKLQAHLEKNQKKRYYHSRRYPDRIRPLTI